jgi:hypothetical protein
MSNFFNICIDIDTIEATDPDLSRLLQNHKPTNQQSSSNDPTTKKVVTIKKNNNEAVKKVFKTVKAVKEASEEVDAVKEVKKVDAVKGAVKKTVKKVDVVKEVKKVDVVKEAVKETVKKVDAVKETVKKVDAVKEVNKVAKVVNKVVDEKAKVVDEKAKVVDEKAKVVDEKAKVIKGVAKVDKKVPIKLNYNNNDRKERGLTQKIFMIEHRKNSELDIEFDVMGTTKNVYTVRITESPICTCPDYVTRNKRCKHIYFVLKRIMKIDELFDGNMDEETDTYTQNQLRQLIKNMPHVMKELVVNDIIKTKYKKLKNSKTEVIKMKDLDDVCCVCFDDLANGDKIDYCKRSCGKPVHDECFKMVSSAKKNPTCLMCGNSWHDDKSNNSYVNLS